MAVRRDLEEPEAHLEPVGKSGSVSGAKGKLEFKRYGDGRRRMKITCKKLDVPEGAGLELVSGDTVIAVLEARNGRAEVDEERDGSEDSPAPAAGDVVNLYHQGVPLLTGRLYLD